MKHMIKLFVLTLSVFCVLLVFPACDSNNMGDVFEGVGDIVADPVDLPSPDTGESVDASDENVTTSGESGDAEGAGEDDEDESVDSDVDGDGYKTEDGDCDDWHSKTYPGAPEICDDRDNDCDTDVDEDCEDVDGEGNDDVDVDGDGYTTEAGDCDDSNATVYPSAPELCDGLDNDCDTNVDEDGVCNVDPIDSDGDGYKANEECDDSDPAINPDAVEVCDGVDNNCDRVVDEGCDDDEDPSDQAVDEGADDEEASSSPWSRASVDTTRWGNTGNNWTGGHHDANPGPSVQVGVIKFLIRELEQTTANMSHSKWQDTTVTITFGNGKKLAGAPLSILHPGQREREYDGNAVEWQTFTVDLVEYANLKNDESSNFGPLEMTGLFRLVAIKSIDLISNETDDWGIHSVRMKAKPSGASDSEFETFYSNPSVWAYLRKNTARNCDSSAMDGIACYEKYPTTQGSCLQPSHESGYELFKTFPGTPDRNGGSANPSYTDYDIWEFPVTPLLRFTPKDHWFQIKMKTANLTYAPSVERLLVKFTGSCDWTKLYVIDKKNTQEEIRFYTGAAVELSDVSNGFSVGLTGPTGGDQIKLKKIYLKMREAWLDDTDVKSYIKSSTKSCPSSTSSTCHIIPAGDHINF
jgi:hypothetical protein